MRVEPGTGATTGTTGTDFGLRPAEAAGGTSPDQGIGDASSVAGSSGPDFGAVLAQGIAQANTLQQDATAKADAVAKGASDDLHGTMITVKEAEIAMKLVGSVRNKLLDAFHELWRINL